MFDVNTVIGVKYGRLTITGFDSVDKHNNYRFYCLCDCGNTSLVRLGALRRGRIQSCGCYNSDALKARVVHGHARNGKSSAEYRAWQNMKNRCYSVNLKCYPNYGGRGIIVCDKWKDDFELFLSDVGRRPSSKHSLDRPNTNGNYEPGNVRWATKKQQQQNTRDNRWFEYEGERLVVSDWANKLKVAPNTILHHLKKKTFTEMMDFYNKKRLKQQMQPS